MLWALALGLVIGLVRWRGLTYLARIPFRRGWILIGALVLQIVALRVVEPGPPGEPDLRGALFLLGYAGVLAGVWLNRQLDPMRVVGIGFALNLIAVLPTFGYMPITAEAYAAAGQARPGETFADGTKLARAKDMVLPRDKTPLWPLTDIIPVRDPSWLRGVYSVGDLVLAAGAILLASGTRLGLDGSRAVRDRADLERGGNGESLET